MDLDLVTQVIFPNPPGIMYSNGDAGSNNKNPYSSIYALSADLDKKVVLIAGPSSSGKTTFSNRLRIQLMTRGINPVKISIDDYYIDRKNLVIKPGEKIDLEDINIIDIKLLNEHLKALIEGKHVTLPTFDFKTGSRGVGRTISVNKDQPIIIEGIHALNDDLTPLISKKNKYKIYIAPHVQVNIDNHTPISSTNIRLLRRIVRDYQYRGYSAENTLAQWDSVRAGEFKWIYKNEEAADFVYNSDLVYEVAVLKKHAEKLLKTIPPSSLKNPSIRSVCFSEGESKVLISDSERGNDAHSNVKVYNFDEMLKAKEVKKTDIKIEPELLITAPGDEKITKAKWLNNNKNIILTSESGIIYNYDSSNGKEIMNKKIHDAEITDIDISKYEEILLTASKDGQSKVLDPDNFDVIQTFFPQNPTRNINSCRISPLMSIDDEEEKRYHAFIAGGQESRDVTTTHSNKGGFELLIYDMLFGKELGAIQGHFGPVNALAISSDGILLATGSEESTIRVNQLNTDEYRNLK